MGHFHRNHHHTFLSTLIYVCMCECMSAAAMLHPISITLNLTHSFISCDASLSRIHYISTYVRVVVHRARVFACVRLYDQHIKTASNILIPNEKQSDTIHNSFAPFRAFSLPAELTLDRMKIYYRWKTAHAINTKPGVVCFFLGIRVCVCVWKIIVENNNPRAVTSIRIV